MKKNNKKSQAAKKHDVNNQLLFGAHPIIEALKAKKRRLISLYTTKPYPKSWNRVKSFLPARFDLHHVEREALTNLTGIKEHMGIAAWFGPFQIRKKMFDPKLNPKILLLDSIQDTRNLGAILRSAYCTNFTGVILCEKNSAPITAATIKASAGLAEHLEICVQPSIGKAIEELKKAGYHMLLSVIKGGKDARQVQTDKPVCLVIGNEEKGISKNIMTNGELVSLPQKESDISYNASVAAGILMFLLGFE